LLPEVVVEISRLHSAAGLTNKHWIFPPISWSTFVSNLQCVVNISRLRFISCFRNLRPACRQCMFSFWRLMLEKPCSCRNLDLLRMGAPICVVTLMPSILWLSRTAMEYNKMLQRGHPAFEEMRIELGT